LFVFGLIAAALLLGGSATALAQAAPVGATSELRDATGRLIANAEFREGRDEVLIALNFPNPPALSGTHALHIDQQGRCDPPDFTTSGNIFNPTNKSHGRQNPEGAEVGDLPNVNFSNGLTTYNTTAIGATLGEGPASLLSPNRSLVIYSGQDDQKTDPEGNSGVPIGCGVIEAVGAPGAAAVAAAAPVVSQASPAPIAVVRVASPVPQTGQPAQPVVQAGQPAQPVVQAAQPGQVPPQPAAQPASSPVVPSRPVVLVSNNSASPTAIVAAAGAVPTPIAVATPFVVAVAAQQPATGGNTLSSTNALIIAILGAGLIGVGWLLRQGRQLR
jgi:Cu-Zn family superoxide dismutase